MRHSVESIFVVEYLREFESIRILSAFTEAVKVTVFQKIGHR
jgi:hypothetical protein